MDARSYPSDTSARRAHRRLPRLAARLALLSVLVAPGVVPGVTPATAQAQEPQPAASQPPAAPGTPVSPAAPTGGDAAREHFRRGEAAYQKGNYLLAISEWETAYVADPRPRIQYNLYQAHERLGDLGKASDALQRYLSTADPDDPYYADATARMAALQQRLQATGIRLVGGVDGATVNVSGHDWGRLPRPDRIPVQPGNHRVLVQLPGYRDFVVNVIVPAAQVVDVPIQLERLAGSEAAQPAGANQGAGSAAVDDSGTDATPFYILSAALAAGAIGTAVWMINRTSELDGCGEAKYFCAEESAVRTQRNIALGATVALGAGAIGVLIYAVLASGDDEASASACVPSVNGGMCRVSF